MSAYVAFEDFDPNNLQGKDTLWGVYAGGGFKMYDKRSHALGRFASWARCKIYEYDPVAARWELRGTKDTASKQGICDVCSMSTMRPMSWGGKPGQMEDTGRFCWNRSGGKIADPLVLLFACTDCRDTHRLR